MLKPMGNRCLIERIEEENRLPSGIFIPETHKEKPLKGKVLAIGSSVVDIANDNIVLFGKYAGTEITLEGKKLLILSAEEILGIFTGE